MKGQQIDRDQMDEPSPKTGFEERQEELADMAQELENLKPEDFFPEDENTELTG